MSCFFAGYVFLSTGALSGRTHSQSLLIRQPQLYVIIRSWNFLAVYPGKLWPIVFTASLDNIWDSFYATDIFLFLWPHVALFIFSTQIINIPLLCWAQLKAQQGQTFLVIKSEVSAPSELSLVQLSSKSTCWGRHAKHSLKWKIYLVKVRKVPILPSKLIFRKQ